MLTFENSFIAGLPRAVSSMSDCRLRGQEFKLQLGYKTFLRINHEITSMAMIQEGQLLVIVKNVH